MNRAERERVAAKIKAYIRHDWRAEAEAQVADMREATAGSTHSDALLAQEMLAMADEARTSAKREHFLRRAWDHTKDYVSIRGTSKGGNKGKKKKQAAAARWQKRLLRIRPEIKRLIDADLSNDNIAARVADKTGTKREAARAPRTVARFIAVWRKAGLKK